MKAVCIANFCKIALRLTLFSVSIVLGEILLINEVQATNDLPSQLETINEITGNSRNSPQVCTAKPEPRPAPRTFEELIETIHTLPNNEARIEFLSGFFKGQVGALLSLGKIGDPILTSVVEEMIPLLLRDFINRKTFDELNSLLTQLQNKFPPKNHVYLGLGRSASLLVTLLNSQTPKRIAWNLPLSLRSERGIAHPEQEKLFAHFDKFLPTERERDGKSVVVLDFVSSGGTILAVQNQIEAYQRHRGKRLVVNYFLYGLSYGLTRLKEQDPQHIEISILEKESPLYYFFLDGESKFISEYDTWTVESPGEPARNPFYEKMARELKLIWQDYSSGAR